MPPSAADPAAAHRPTRLLAWVASAVAVLLGAAAVVSWLQPEVFGQARAVPMPEPTPRTAELYAATDSNAAQAALEDPRFAELAATPQSKWYADWSTVETAYDDARGYVTAARDAGQIPQLVLYQIPDRDCGLYAQGGLEGNEEYLGWVSEIARALTDIPESIVVVEPDALPMAGECQSVEARTEVLRDVVETLAPTGATIYIDAGHSSWIEPDEMAERLIEAGVEDARGFSTNVSNFRSTEHELEYAQAVVNELAERGVDDVGFIIDTSRNGAEVEVADVCNPQDALVGERPQLFSGSWLDGYLWVKAVGEPDGPCNGAPIGQYFWPEEALRLLGES